MCGSSRRTGRQCPILAGLPRGERGKNSRRARISRGLCMPEGPPGRRVSGLFRAGPKAALPLCAAIVPNSHIQPVHALPKTWGAAGPRLPVGPIPERARGRSSGKRSRFLTVFRHLSISAKLWAAVAALMIAMLSIVGFAAWRATTQQQAADAQLAVSDDKLRSAAAWAELSKITITRAVA